MKRGRQSCNICECINIKDEPRRGDLIFKCLLRTDKHKRSYFSYSDGKEERLGGMVTAKRVWHEEETWRKVISRDENHHRQLICRQVGRVMTQMRPSRSVHECRKTFPTRLSLSVSQSETAIKPESLNLWANKIRNLKQSVEIRSGS